VGLVTSATDDNRHHGGHDQAGQQNAGHPAADRRAAAAELHDLVAAAAPRPITGHLCHTSSLHRQVFQQVSSCSKYRATIRM
jgi:hypothetical protein